VLRRMFGLQKEEVAGGWRTLHNEELHNLCGSPNIIRQIKSTRMRLETCSTHGRDEKCIQNFGQKTRRKKSTRKTQA
jgi:23S rRNA A2030 N6-methylase RlmJ